MGREGILVLRTAQDPAALLLVAGSYCRFGVCSTTSALRVALG